MILPGDRPPQRGFRPQTLILLVVGVLAVAACAAIFWPGTGAVTTLVVPEGAGARRLARDFRSAGVLSSEKPFLFWTKVRGAGGKIHVGRYSFKSGRSAFWIVSDLIGGRTEKIKVVIPEGWASWQIADRLQSEGVCDGTAFLDIVKAQKLEGYLFPATYELDAGLSAASVAKRMRDKFDQVWTPELAARAQQIGMTKEQVVTLASIVEREVRVREEGPMISAVYHNRLNKGMR
ncbi:MAG: endolytic transglycosylase MltG, partial [Elusimicrobia bacterium]|nr:endolytic transglycosylase MltG [Elusimicrobiota bacterium]